jgi:hypothetical protein
MKRFIKELVMYSIGFTILSFALTGIIYSIDFGFYEAYEDHYIALKYAEIKRNKDAYNTLFLGTSRTRRQIIPELFDSLTDTNTATFNMAGGGLKSYRLYNQAKLSSELKRYDTIFYEVSNPAREGGVNYKTNAVMYSVSLRNFISIYDYIQKDNSLTFEDKFALHKNNVLEFLYKYYGFGVGYHIQLFLSESKQFSDTELDERFSEHHGYTEGVDKTASFSEEDRFSFYEFHERKINELVEEHRSFVLNEYVEEEDLYIKDLKKLATNLASKGTNMVFMLPPRADNLEYNLKAKYYLQQAGFIVLDFLDPDIYPEYYKLELSQDFLHLNKEGAELYTTEFARKFNELQK